MPLDVGGARSHHGRALDAVREVCRLRKVLGQDSPALLERVYRRMPEQMRHTVEITEPDNRRRYNQRYASLHRDRSGRAALMDTLDGAKEVRRQERLRGEEWERVHPEASPTICPACCGPKWRGATTCRDCKPKRLLFIFRGVLDD